MQGWGNCSFSIPRKQPQEGLLADDLSRICINEVLQMSAGQTLEEKEQFGLRSQS
jgi:hypothetical protein